MRQSGNKHRPRQNAPGGGNQAADNRSGNHPGQRTGVADIITSRAASNITNP
jgi:hypothetical protein